MTSENGKQIIVICMYSNISWSKGCRKMKFGQLIEYKKGFFFWKNYAENKTERLARDFFFVFKNSLYELKAID